MSPNSHRVAIAILQQRGRLLLQLRDDIPGIVYPGYWAMFGGHIEPGETPEVAVKRELQEEIGYLAPMVSEFGRYPTPQVVRHVFHAPLAVGVEQLDLKEGWDLGLWTPEEIQRGDRYSERAGQVRALGTPHRQILLEFLDSEVYDRLDGC